MCPADWQMIVSIIGLIYDWWTLKISRSNKLCVIGKITSPKADKHLTSPLLPLCTRSKLDLIFSFETDHLIHIRLWEGWRTLYWGTLKCWKLKLDCFIVDIYAFMVAKMTANCIWCQRHDWKAWLWSFYLKCNFKKKMQKDLCL